MDESQAAEVVSDSAQAAESVMDSAQAAEAVVDSAQSVEPAAESALQAAQTVDLSGVNDGMTAIVGKLDGINTLIQSQSDHVNTLVSGLVTVEMFSLLAQLLLLGVVLVVIFVVALRRV